MLGAIVEHLLGLGKAAHKRADQALAASHKAESMNCGRIRGDTHEAHRAIAFQQGKISVEIMVG